jgi:hypothetical protein
MSLDEARRAALRERFRATLAASATADPWIACAAAIGLLLLVSGAVLATCGHHQAADPGPVRHSDSMP